MYTVLVPGLHNNNAIVGEDRLPEGVNLIRRDGAVRALHVCGKVGLGARDRDHVRHRPLARLRRRSPRNRPRADSRWRGTRGEGDNSNNTIARQIAWHQCGVSILKI